MRQRRAINPTTYKMAYLGLKFRRRVEIPCWHHDHIKKVVRLFREYAENIEKIAEMETMLNHEKVSLVQHEIQRMNWAMQRLTPLDPRERGSEQGGYDHQFGSGYLNTNGFDHVNGRDDLDERLHPGPNMRGARRSGNR